MSSLCSINEVFLWKSHTSCVWRSNPDQLDHVLGKIHTAATVCDAILRNDKNPTMEKMEDTIKFLERHNFWRSLPSTVHEGCTDTQAVNYLLKIRHAYVQELWDLEDKENSSQRRSTSRKTYADNYVKKIPVKHSILATSTDNSAAAKSISSVTDDAHGAYYCPLPRQEFKPSGLTYADVARKNGKSPIGSSSDSQSQ